MDVADRKEPQQLRVVCDGGAGIRRRNDIEPFLMFQRRTVAPSAVAARLVLGNRVGANFDGGGWARHDGSFRRRRNLRVDRSEEHTSELQSLRDLVCRLLLE